MIRPIDIRLNAAHPELKLPESVTYTGSPSTVLIRGVPPNCGRWAITAVSVAATFPDGSTTTRAAVQSANGVWVATLPGTATSGRTTDGFRVIADGIDENGEAVTGYIIAVADFAVASLDVTPAPQPGETSYQMLYFDAVPSVLRKGDVAKIDGVLKFYNGEAWEAFATPPALDDAVARDSANGVKSSGIWSAIWGALAALPTGFSSLYDWVVDRLAGKLDATNGVASGLVVAFGNYGIRWYTRSSTEYTLELVARPSASSSWQAIRTFYIPQATTGNLALVEQIISKAIEAIAPEFSILYSYKVGQLVRKDGILYICTTAHPSATQWDASHFSANATVESALAVIRAAIPVASTSTPKMDDAGSAGSSTAYARGDHVHPSDSTKLDKSGPSNRKIQWNEGSGTLDIVDPNGGHLLFLNNAYSSGEIVASREYVDDKTPYKLTTKTISNGAVSLDDRAINAVAVSSALASLTVNFPTATSGKARDFGLRLTVASGITTAPELALPQGVTCENADGAAPEIGADGAATILYFTETASGVFLVKGEVVTAIS